MIALVTEGDDKTKDKPRDWICSYLGLGKNDGDGVHC